MAVWLLLIINQGWLRYFDRMMHLSRYDVITTIFSQWKSSFHYSDVIVSAMASQIIGVSIVYSTVFFSGTDKKKYHNSASLALARGIHRSPVNSPHKGPVTRKMFHYRWRHHVVWKLRCYWWACYSVRSLWYYMTLSQPFSVSGRAVFITVTS